MPSSPTVHVHPSTSKSFIQNLPHPPNPQTPTKPPNSFLPSFLSDHPIHPHLTRFISHSTASNSIFTMLASSPATSIYFEIGRQSQTQSIDLVPDLTTKASRSLQKRSLLADIAPFLVRQASRSSVFVLQEQAHIFLTQADQ